MTGFLFGSPVPPGAAWSISGGGLDSSMLSTGRFRDGYGLADIIPSPNINGIWMGFIVIQWDLYWFNGIYSDFWWDIIVIQWDINGIYPLLN